MKPELLTLDAFGMPGVSIWKLPVIGDRRGWVRLQAVPAMSQADPVIAEVYCSAVYENIVKAWHLHRMMTLRYSCIQGVALVGLVDTRGPERLTGSLTLDSGRHQPMAIVIPPGVWNEFRLPAWAQAHDMAVILNCADLLHEDLEMERRPPDAFPFDWGPYEAGG